MPLLGGPSSLADVPQLWGWRRDRWTRQGGAVLAGLPVVPVSRDHAAATLSSRGLCGLHFMFDGAAFEILFAGAEVAVTLVVDGGYASDRIVRTTLGTGAPVALNAPNAFTRFDFGAAQSRRLSLYAQSTQGPCALAIPAGSSLQPWDRSEEASFSVIADSYGGAPDALWGDSGPFYEAAASLGLVHLDRDAMGGTGYAPNNANADTRNPGNAFPARVPGLVDVAPDLVLSCGGINDNNAFAAPPLYATADAARAGFEAGVASHFQALRAALPQSVLAATGPWAPRQAVPTDPVALSKGDTIRAALAAAGGPWIYLDNLRGGWSNSAGASAQQDGPWQTGTGHEGAPAGDGNGDLYLAADGTHPNEAGCTYLAALLATGLRAALNAL